MSKCRECNSPTGMTWFVTKTIPSDIVQGRLTTNDVEIGFIYGCATCSELEKTLTSERMIEYVQELENHRDHSRKLYKQWEQEKIDLRAKAVNAGINAVESFCAFLKSDHHLDKATHDAAVKFMEKLINEGK